MEETVQVKSSLIKVLSRQLLIVLFCTTCVPISHVMFWQVDLLVIAMLFSFLKLSSLCYVHLVPDIDECLSENNCRVNATCTNTMGSYNCTCKKGYGGDGGGCPGKVQSNEGIITTHIDSFLCTP